MPVNLSLQLDKRFKRRLVARYQGHEMQVGVLKDKPHYAARYLPKNGTRRAFGKVDGMRVRRKTRRSYTSVAAVSEAMRKELNFYVAPFRTKSRERDQFTQTFLRYVSNPTASLKSKAVMLLQAVVRKPFKTRAYGSNTAATAKAKGFNRRGVDTGQLYQNIKAMIRRIRRV